MPKGQRDIPFPNWEDAFENKTNSIYYEILVKKYGQKKADKYWKLRDWRVRYHDGLDNIYPQVIDYHPRNILNVIG